MRSPLAARIAAWMVVGLSGCAHQTTEIPFDVLVRGPASSCSFEVGGRKVTMDELLVIARSEAKPGRRAHIDSNMAETPYRCFGGAIYMLQMAGFKDVGFIAEPPPKGR